MERADLEWQEAYEKAESLRKDLTRMINGIPTIKYNEWLERLEAAERKTAQALHYAFRKWSDIRSSR